MKNILFIGFVWPEPNSSAAGSRMMQLLDFFINKEFEVTFATTASKSMHRADLESQGINIVSIELNNPSFDTFLEELQPEIVVFDRFMIEEQFGWRVDDICPDAFKILDTEDLHFLRKYREVEFKGKNISSLEESELAKREIASIYRCDLSLVISEVEAKLLKEKFQISENLLHYLPFLPEKCTPENVFFYPSYSERKNFISIGNFRHAPNVDAVKYLKNDIWPLIKMQLPTAEAHIYGAYPSEKITALHDPKSGFLIKGWAKNAGEVVKYSRVSLAPIRFGAGLKGKLIEAMQCGTPNVTTTVGAEGINGELRWNGYIENGPEEFAAAAVDLYTTEFKWRKAQENGYKILDSRFSVPENSERFYKRIMELQNNLKEHRKNNFTGGMLRHHRVKSTHYLSKYIEAKAKVLAQQTDK